MPSSQFHPIDAKLYAWTELYERLKESKARYREASSRADPICGELLQEIKDLDRRCVVALAELNSEYAKAKIVPPQ